MLSILQVGRNCSAENVTLFYCRNYLDSYHLKWKLEICREFEAGLIKYKPDIIISVHPLMQHIPLWVLKWQMFQKRVIFVTVITDLNTCHPTWCAS